MDQTTATTISPKAKNYIKILVIILIVIVLIAIGIFCYPFILAATNREYRTIADIPEPTQNLTSSNTTTRITGTNWTANAKHLASYQIEGLVVGVEDYDGNSLYDKISPRDISIAWGDMAAHNNLITWKRGHREMNAEVTILAEWLIGKNYDQLFSQYSNNHLIFNDESIQRATASVKRGDHIKMSGFLVDVTIRETSERGAYYKLTSSLHRDDEGDGSCEVILVTDIQILD